MISIRKVWPVLALLLIMSAAYTGCSKFSQSDPTPVEPASTTVDAAALYEKNCAVCHGANGEGIEEMGPELQSLNIRIPHDDQIEHIIRNGRDKMPPFSQISDADLDALIQYIRAFEKT